VGENYRWISQLRCSKDLSIKPNGKSQTCSTMMAIQLWNLIWFVLWWLIYDYGTCGWYLTNSLCQVPVDQCDDFIVMIIGVMMMVMMMIIISLVNNCFTQIFLFQRYILISKGFISFTKATYIDHTCSKEHDHNDIVLIC
jgi:hypothetical protein